MKQRKLSLLTINNPINDLQQLIKNYNTNKHYKRNNKNNIIITKLNDTSAFGKMFTITNVNNNKYIIKKIEKPLYDIPSQYNPIIEEQNIMYINNIVDNEYLLKYIILKNERNYYFITTFLTNYISLQEYIKNDINIIVKCKILLKIINGIEFIYSNNIIHDDLHIGNIFIQNTSYTNNIPYNDINIKFIDYGKMTIEMIQPEKYKQFKLNFIQYMLNTLFKINIHILYKLLSPKQKKDIYITLSTNNTLNNTLNNKNIDNTLSSLIIKNNIPLNTKFIEHELTAKVLILNPNLYDTSTNINAQLYTNIYNIFNDLNFNLYTWILQ